MSDLDTPTKRRTRTDRVCPVCRRRTALIPLSARVCSVDCGLRVREKHREGRLPHEQWPIVGETWQTIAGPAQIVYVDPYGRSFEYVRYSRRDDGRRVWMAKSWGRFGVYEIAQGHVRRIEEV